MGLEVPEAAELKPQPANDRFLYPQVKVNKLAWPVTQLEKACTEYAQAEQVTTHVCCGGYYGVWRRGSDDAAQVESMMDTSLGWLGLWMLILHMEFWAQTFKWRAEFFLCSVEEIGLELGNPNGNFFMNTFFLPHQPLCYACVQQQVAKSHFVQ